MAIKNISVIHIKQINTTLFCRKRTLLLTIDIVALRARYSPFAIKDITADDNGLYFYI